MRLQTTNWLGLVFIDAKEIMMVVVVVVCVGQQHKGKLSQRKEAQGHSRRLGLGPRTQRTLFPPYKQKAVKKRQKVHINDGHEKVRKLATL